MSTTDTPNLTRPWWKDPLPIGFGLFIFASAVFVMCRGWAPTPVDPTGHNISAPADGFCNTAVAPQSTLQHPTDSAKP